MLYLMIGLWTVTIAATVLAFVLRSPREVAMERLRQAARLQREVGAEGEWTEDERAFSVRVLKPMLSAAGGLFRRYLRPSAALEELLESAGRPWGMSGLELIGLKCLSGAVGLLSAAILIPFIIAIGFPPAAPFLVITPLVGFLAPNMVLRRIAKKRQFEIRLQLPDVLDLIILSMEAGQGFDRAMMTAVQRNKGPLRQELMRVLSEVSRGRPHVESLRDMANRCKVEELSLLVATVHQAQQLGISIGASLRELSEQLRKERLQRAREVIAKLPVLMLFPLLIFIFPALLIVLLGPAAVLLSGALL